MGYDVPVSLGATTLAYDPVPGDSAAIAILAQLRPYVRHCGLPRRSGWKIEQRRLLDYLLMYIDDGQGLCEIGNQSYEMTSGDLFFVPPDTLHSLEGLEPGLTCPYVHFDLIYRPGISHWDFSIPGGMVDMEGLQNLMHPPVPLAPVARLSGRIRARNNAKVGELIKEVAAEAARAQPYAQLRMSGLMLEIMAELLRGQQALDANYDEHAISLEQAAEMVKNKPDTSVEELAACCNLSNSHFRKLFARHFGCSPREFLCRSRIRHAKSLMAGGNLTLSQIATRCGFATVHSFSRAFRALEGISPTEYRRCGKPSIYVEGRFSPYPR